MADTNNIPLEIEGIIRMGFKIPILILLSIYTIASLLLIKQIKLMNQTIISPSNKYILIIGYIHVIFVMLIFLFAIFAL